MKKLFFNLCFLFIFGFNSNAWATNGAQLLGYSAAHEGFAGAGAALPLDYSCGLVNPAGCGDLDNQVGLNFFAGFPETELNTSPTALGNAAAGTQTSNEDGVFLPNAGLLKNTKLLGHRVTLGLSILSVAGFGLDYDQSRLNPALLSGGSDFDRSSFFGLYKILPSMAYKINNKFLVGGALHINRAVLSTDSNTGLAGGFTQTGGKNRLDGAWGVGHSLAGLYKHNDKLSFGVNYISKQYMEKFERYGDVLSNTDYPLQVTAGIAYNPFEKWTFLFDFKWINWSDSGFGTRVSEGGLGWQDQFVGIFGVQWGITNDLTLRAGFNHARSVVPSESLFASGLASPIFENHLSLGFGWRLNKAMKFDFSYVRSFENTVTDNNPLTAGAFVKQSGNQASFQLTVYY